MRIRDLLPWRDFVIETSWPPDVATIELRKRVGPIRAPIGEATPFVGAGDQGVAFRFSRRITYRNSFVPIITVLVEPSRHDGARVLVRMRLHPFVMVFAALWMTGASVGSLAGLTLLARGDATGLAWLVFPLFGVALTGGAFGFEAYAAERLLRDVFARAPAR